MRGLTLSIVRPHAPSSVTLARMPAASFAAWTSEIDASTRYGRRAWQSAPAHPPRWWRPLRRRSTWRMPRGPHAAWRSRWVMAILLATPPAALRANGSPVLHVLAFSRHAPRPAHPARDQPLGGGLSDRPSNVALRVQLALFGYCALSVVELELQLTESSASAPPDPRAPPRAGLRRIERQQLIARLHPIPGATSHAQHPRLDRTRNHLLHRSHAPFAFSVAAIEPHAPPCADGPCAGPSEGRLHRSREEKHDRGEGDQRQRDSFHAPFRGLPGGFHDRYGLGFSRNSLKTRRPSWRAVRDKPSPYGS